METSLYQITDDVQPSFFGSLEFVFTLCFLFGPFFLQFTPLSSCFGLLPTNSFLRASFYMKKELGGVYAFPL